MSRSPSELADLYEAHASAIFAFVLNLTRHEADAKDCLQETFFRLANQTSLLRGVRAPRAFLLKMAYRLAIDSHRRASVRERHGADQPGETIFAPAPNPDEETFRRAVAAAMAVLPADQRAVVHLKLWEHLTFDEIAQALDLSANTAASRYRYGIDKLREALRPIYEEIQ